MTVLHHATLLPKPYFQDDAVTLYHGDCMEIVPLLRTVDVILTDPPFYLPAHIFASRKEWPRTLASLAIMDFYFRNAFGVLVERLKATGAFYTFCDSTSFAVFLASLFPLFDRTQSIVWNKGQGGMGNGWRHAHELLVHGAFSTTVYTDGFRKDVLDAPVVPSESRLHPSEKPIEVIKAILAAHPPGIVLDPFAGSGTTLRAAKDMGWKAIGVEYGEAEVEIAAKRMSQGVLL